MSSAQLFNFQSDLSCRLFRLTHAGSSAFDERRSKANRVGARIRASLWSRPLN